MLYSQSSIRAQVFAFWSNFADENTSKINECQRLVYCTTELHFAKGLWQPLFTRTSVVHHRECA